MSIQQLRTYVWFFNCLTSRKTIFQSCWDGQVIRGRGFEGVLHGGVLAYKGSTQGGGGGGGGGGGRVRLDIQFKITFLRMIIHLCTFILISELPYQTV